MNILAAVDFSAVTQDVTDALRRIAATMPAKVILVHVAPPEPDFVGYSAGPDVVRGQVAVEHRARHQQLQRLAEDLRADEIDTTALLLQGATVETLIAEAEKLGAGLIVLGSHGHGAVYDILVGSVAEGVVRRSTVPVLLVPARQ
ncbi:MAG TPA: universal stress protein [Steroidobacteraceae bacterium]|nr:universal stress protein [Steroidobacteraceae bacterium]